MNRRHFLLRTGKLSLAFMGLRSALVAGASSRMLACSGGGTRAPGYGPLVRDPKGIFDLPQGFSYRQLHLQGGSMSDGLVVPGHHDGMAAFDGGNGRILLVVNHELTNLSALGPFGARNQLLGQVPPGLVYDIGAGKTPSLGGTTTVVFNPDTLLVEKSFLSLAGTARNCAGGPTPWGSWLSCEESVAKQGETYDKDHGWVFEVPAGANTGLTAPQPLIAMGRFNHEAAAVDPLTGIVYMTEDRPDGVLYRFVPAQPGNLGAGGVLQALRVVDRFGLNATNHGALQQIPQGAKLDVDWVTLQDVTSPNDDLRLQAAAKGAAVFTRGEGTWYGNDSLYFACTDGGILRLGQIWRLRRGEQLELWLEPNHPGLLQQCDNITLAPTGDLIVCEDGSGTDYLVGVTPAGETYWLGRNRVNTDELAGAAFSPCGRWLFVNLYTTGRTLAVTGPW